MEWSPHQVLESILAGVAVGLLNRFILGGACCDQCMALGGDSEDESEESTTSLAASEAGVITADVTASTHHHAAPS